MKTRRGNRELERASVRPPSSRLRHTRSPACLLDLWWAFRLERRYFLTDLCWTGCFSGFHCRKALLTGDDICWQQKTGPLFPLIGSRTEMHPCCRTQTGRMGKTATYWFAKSGICTVRELLKKTWFVIIILERACQNKLQGVFLEMEKCAVNRCSYYTQHASFSARLIVHSDSQTQLKTLWNQNLTFVPHMSSILYKSLRSDFFMLLK